MYHDPILFSIYTFLITILSANSNIPLSVPIQCNHTNYCINTLISYTITLNDVNVIRTYSMSSLKQYSSSLIDISSTYNCLSFFTECIPIGHIGITFDDKLLPKP